MKAGFRILSAGGLALTVAALVTACAATSDSIPEARGSGALEGRRLYLTCAGSCHAPEPPANYSREEWITTHLPDMVRRAKLTGPERAALERYVLSACR